MEIKGYWKLNGNVNDYSGNGYNLTNSGVDFITAHFGSTALFNSSSDILYTNINSGLNNNFTLSCWVKKTASNYIDMLISSWVGSYNNYWIALTINYTMKAGIYLFDGMNNPGGDGNTTLSYNQWYYIVATRNGNCLSLYVNGVLDGRWTENTSSIPAYSIFGIGHQYNDNTRYFPGYIDEVIIDTSAWSAADVMNQYMQYLGMW